MTSLAREVEALEAPDSDEDLFAELDAIIAESSAKSKAEADLKAKQKRLATLARQGKEGVERDSLLAEVRRLEESIVWRPVSATALFHVQRCTSCGAVTRFFMGWMTEQQHRTDPTGRRLTRGKPIEDLPQRYEEHDQGPVPFCGQCFAQHLPPQPGVPATCSTTSFFQQSAYHRPSSWQSDTSSDAGSTPPASPTPATSAMPLVIAGC